MIAETAQTKSKRSKPAKSRLPDPIPKRTDYLDPEDAELVREMTRVRAEREADERQIQSIPLGQLVRHPRNRRIDPADPEIKQLAGSIAEHGQLEPLRVRPIANDKYQIISGERRYTALTLANIYAAKCIVVDISDAVALTEVAAANGHRKDLNPIERAELMQELMKPADKGGSGLALVDAGRIFGLTSESGCKNALRMLKLPAAIRDLVVSGEIPERVARRLVPYAAAPKVMDAIAHELTNTAYADESMASLWLSSDQPYFIEEAVRENTRPISDDIKHRYPYPIGEHPCLFDWSAKADELDIVDLPFAVDHDHNKHCDVIEQRKFALNTKLWDRLNEPLAKAAHEQSKKVPEGSKAGSTKARALTPAEQKAADKRKADEAEQRLDGFSNDWLGRLVRCALSSRSTDDALVALTLPYLMSQCGQNELRTFHESALVECQVTVTKNKSVHFGVDTLPSLVPVRKKKESLLPFEILSANWRLILWPVSRLIGDAAKRSSMTPAGELPDGLVYMHLSKLIELAAMASVSVETAWQSGATDASDERRLISAWLCRHTKAQLHKLRAELNVTEGGEHMGREELAGCVLNAHRPGKPLPVPKRLQKLVK